MRVTETYRASSQIARYGARKRFRNACWVLRFGHWACGWYELILAHPSLESRVDEIQAALESYSVWDEEDFSRREYEEAQEIWEMSDLADRLHYLKTCGSDPKPSIFSIRRDEMPSGLYASDLVR